MGETRPLSVVIADDDAAMKAALVELLESEPRISLGGVASDADEAVELVKALSPDVILLDLRMPGGGEQAARTIGGLAPATRVVVLTAQDDQATRRSLTAAGVARFLAKGVPGNAILEAILEA